MIEVKESVINQLRTHCQVDSDEIGGVLTGSITSENRLRISNVSEPCPILNLSNRCACIRDASRANKFIQEDFERSDHTRIYLGEWHTHPENDPHPSSVDIESIIEIYNKSDIVIDGDVLVIVGLKSNYYGFYDGKSMKEKSITIV